MKNYLLITLLLSSPICIASDTAKPLSLQCETGSTIIGAEPPAGLEYYCVDAQGNKNGSYKSWYENGQLMQHLHYKAGKEHGKQQAWWPNGRLMMEGISVEGVRYQGFKYWDMLGRPSTIKFK